MKSPGGAGERCGKGSDGRFPGDIVAEARNPVCRGFAHPVHGCPCHGLDGEERFAIDLNDGTIKWESVLGTVRDLAPVPLPWKKGTPNFGGPVVTAGGVVFIGAAMDNYLRAFDASSGEELWKGRLPAGGQATPMTYEWEGRQYVVIAAGGHSTSTTTRGDFMVAFALPH